MSNDQSFFPSVRSAFDHWRVTHRASEGRGLAWFLANEFCERFYSSHGIVPLVIDHDGLGFYGIELAHVPCSVNGKDTESLGRLTIGGDVENWRTGGPGDHGLDAIALCDGGMPTSDIVERAILHMAIPPIPGKTHALCRHKLRGASYELIFRIAAMVALRSRSTSIWNHPDSLRSAGLPHGNDQEDPGAFVFTKKGESELVVSGDGRVLRPTAEHLWVSYMRGTSVDRLVALVRSKLEVDGNTGDDKW